jgi:hypothetical protein
MGSSRNMVMQINQEWINRGSGLKKIAPSI